MCREFRTTTSTQADRKATHLALRCKTKTKLLHQSWRILIHSRGFDEEDFWCDVSPTLFQLNDQENQIHFELLSINHNITTQLSVDCAILLPWVALFQFKTRVVEQSEAIRLSIYFIPSWRLQAPAEEWIALFRRYQSVFWPVVVGLWCVLSLLPLLLSKQILSDTQQHKFRTFFRQRF